MKSFPIFRCRGNNSIFDIVSVDINRSQSVLAQDYGNTSPSTALNFGTATSGAYGFEDYVRATGENRYYIISVPAYYSLEVTMYQPATTSIDYDMYAYEIWNGGLYYLPTAINKDFGKIGPSSTCYFEEVAIPNDFNSVAYYLIEIHSVRGSSATLPVSLEWQANPITVSSQSQITDYLHNIWNKQSLAISQRKNDITNRKLLTAVCGNWYEVHPSELLAINFNVDSQVVGANLVVDVYTAATDVYGKLILSKYSKTNGMYVFNSGYYYYLNVHSSNYVTNPQVNYKLSYEVDNSILCATYTYSIEDITGPLKNRTVGSVTLPTFSSVITAKGYAYDSAGNPLKYVPVELIVYLSNNEIKRTIPVAYTDSAGYYNAQTPVGPPAPWYYYSGGVGHYYDIVTIQYKLGNQVRHSLTAFHW